MATQLLVREHDAGVKPELRTEPIRAGDSPHSVALRAGAAFDPPLFGTSDLLAIAEALHDEGFTVTRIELRDLYLLPVSDEADDRASATLRTKINAGEVLSKLDSPPAELDERVIAGVSFRTGDGAMHVDLSRHGRLEVTGRGQPAEDAAPFVAALSAVWAKADLW